MSSNIQTGISSQSAAERARGSRQEQVVKLSGFAKNLIAWHSQRPNLSYGETKIFDSDLSLRC
jgi:hypothetical protein